LTPCLVAPLLKGFHGVTLAMPILVLTATSYHDGKWRKFILALCLLLLAKEVFTLTAISLGILALFQRRTLKWFLVPLILGLGYGLFLRGWFFPMMLKDSTYYYDSKFGGWKYALKRLLSQGSLSFLSTLLIWGGGWWVLRSPYSLLAISSAAPYMLLGGGFLYPNNHYILEPSFWIFCAGAFSLLEKRKDAVDWNTHQERRLFSFLACLALMNMTLYQDLPYYRHHRLEGSYLQALAKLPLEATVGLGVPMEDHLYKIRRYYWTVYGGYQPNQACTWAKVFTLQGEPGEYALLHKGMGNPDFLPEDKEHIRSCWDVLEKDPAYQIVWQDSVLILLKKNG